MPQAVGFWAPYATGLIWLIANYIKNDYEGVSDYKPGKKFMNQNFHEIGNNPDTGLLKAQFKKQMILL